MRNWKTIFVLSALISLSASAHEGHDHGPGSVKPQKGGVVRSLEAVHLELLTDGKNIKIYVFDTGMKPSEAKQYPASLTATLPKKKPEALTLTPKGDHWEAAFDPKNAHRFDLELAIKQGGHDDKVKWTVEPKRK